MAYNFPAGPAVGDTYTSPDGKLTYGWNGFAWDMKAKTAAAQRPELISLAPYMVESGATDVEIRFNGDLLTPATQVILIPNDGAGTEQVLPTTFISLTEVSAVIPNSTVVGDDSFNLYLETEGLRSLTMREVAVFSAPTHNYLDPVSVAAGGPVFNIWVYSTYEYYNVNSGGVSLKVSFDGVDMGRTLYADYIQINNVTPAAIPGAHEIVVRLEESPSGNNDIVSHDPPLIFTYT